MKTATTLVCGLLAAFAISAQAQDDDKKMRPVCKMGTADVHLTADGWSGPKCITADGAGEAVPSALAAEKARVAKANKDGKPADAKRLCKMNQPDVHLTAGGWAGPNCTTSDGSGNPSK